MSQAVAQEFEGLVVLFIFDHALNLFHARSTTLHRFIATPSKPGELGGYAISGMDLLF